MTSSFALLIMEKGGGKVKGRVPQPGLPCSPADPLAANWSQMPPSKQQELGLLKEGGAVRGGGGERLNGEEKPRIARPR